MNEEQLLALAMSWRTGADELRRKFRDSPARAEVMISCAFADAQESCAARLEAIAHAVEEKL